MQFICYCFNRIQHIINGTHILYCLTTKIMKKNQEGQKEDMNVEGARQTRNMRARGSGMIHDKEKRNTEVRGRVQGRGRGERNVQLRLRGQRQGRGRRNVDDRVGPRDRLCVREDMPTAVSELLMWRNFQGPDFFNRDWTPTKLFELFFDEEVCNLICSFSILYAQQQGNHSFQLDHKILKAFLAILFHI